ncbi:hypothetical protein ABK040_014939 [Willaertia magna]
MSEEEIYINPSIIPFSSLLISKGEDRGSVIPPPLSGHSSCSVFISHKQPLSSSEEETFEQQFIIFFAGIGIGFKRLNTIWILNTKSYHLKKYEFLDPTFISTFISVNPETVQSYFVNFTTNSNNTIFTTNSTTSFVPTNGNNNNSLKFKFKLKKPINNNQPSSSSLLLDLDSHWSFFHQQLSQLTNFYSQKKHKSLQKNVCFQFPIPRERHACCTLPRNKSSNNLVVLFGGIGNQKVRLNDVWFLDLEKMVWREGKLKNYYNQKSNQKQESCQFVNDYDVLKDRFYSTWVSPFLSPKEISTNGIYQSHHGKVTYSGIEIPSPRYYHTLCAVNDHLLILFGGYDGDIQNDCWLLQIIDLNELIFEWKRIEIPLKIPYPEVRYNHWAGMLKDRMLLFGGNSKNGQLNDVWAFDLNSYGWKCLMKETNQQMIEEGNDSSSSMGELLNRKVEKLIFPEGRSDHKCVIVDKYLILVGGVHKKRYLSTVYILNLETLTWSVVKKKNKEMLKLEGRIGFTMEVIKEKNTIFIFGGILTDYERDQNIVSRSNEMLVLDTTINSTSNLSKINFLNENRISKYIIQRHIGTGGQGKVFLVLDETENQLFALKRMDIEFEENVGFGKSLASDSVFNEILIVQQLRHENVLPILSFFLERESQNATKLILNILMPYCESGDFSILISKKKNQWKKNNILFDEILVTSWLIQIANGLAYIHSKQIIHRDVKPTNIFVTTNNKKEVKLLLSDFGLAKNVSQSLAKTTCGTMLYLAPEIYNSENYNERADIWSFGCILAFILNGGQLYIDCKIASQKRKLLKSIQDNDLFNKLEGRNEYLELMNKCLEMESEKRPSANELVLCLKELQMKLEKQKEEKLKQIRDKALITTFDNNISVGSSSGDSSDSNNQIIQDTTQQQIENNQIENNTASLNNTTEPIEILANRQYIVDEDLDRNIIEREQIELSSTLLESSFVQSHIKDLDQFSLDKNIGDEQIWIELHTKLLELEHLNLLSEEQMDVLCNYLMSCDLFLKRTYLACLEFQKTIIISEENDLNHLLVKQLKRFLKLKTVMSNK